MANYCPNCSAKVDPHENFCQYCGTTLDHLAKKPQKNASHAQSLQSDQNSSPVNRPYPGAPKYQIVAGLLAIIFGTFGVHKFYMNKTGKGILYLIFFFTGVPTMLGFIEGLLYLTDSEEVFQERLNPSAIFPPKQPERDKWFTGMLAIIFGVCGAQHYFLHDGKGIWFTVFSLTGIPMLISFVEGLIIFFEPKQNFELRYGY